MTPHAWITLAIVVGAIALFASGKVRIDLVALIVLVLLVVLGLVSSDEALTGLMGHHPSVVLMVGIAISVAHSAHADPQPFVVAVAVATATSFATPVGYSTNTMVYYAGRYRIPLTAVSCALSIILIPYFRPLQ
jgi:di/tricarboxylate transporter